MNDCQKLANRVFVCLVIVVLAIFLTGCHSVKWEWLPKQDPYRQNENLKPPFSIKGTKMDSPTPQGVVILKGSF